MKLTPIKSYREPGYPTSGILAQHPELLRVLPRRWRNNRLILGALAGILALSEQSPALATDKPTLRVAPVFLHGEGVVAFGGVGGSVRGILTEAEAREVIETEAKKAGLVFSERDHIIENVRRPVTTPYPDFDEIRRELKEKEAKTSQTSDLKLNGWNSKLRVGYKFVSEQDFEAWESDALKRLAADETSAIYLPTAGTYEMLDAAKRLQAGLKTTKASGSVVVFYEPAATAPKNVKEPSMLLPYDPNDKSLSQKEKEALNKEQEEAWNDYGAAAKDEDKKELRNQVRDFIAWLKAQGVI